MFLLTKGPISGSGGPLLGGQEVATASISGTFVSILVNFDMTASGEGVIGGTFASTFANSVLAATGTLTSSGTFASILNNFDMTASGASGNITGTFTSILANFTMSSGGDVFTPGAGIFNKDKRVGRHDVKR